MNPEAPVMSTRIPHSAIGRETDGTHSPSGIINRAVASERNLPQTARPRAWVHAPTSEVEAGALGEDGVMIGGAGPAAG